MITYSKQEDIQTNNKEKTTKQSVSFKVKEKIGKGTYSTVYKIDFKDSENDKIDWVMKKHSKKSEQKYILREKMVLNQLRKFDHPNIVKVNPLTGDDFDILEFCSGGELFDLVFTTKHGFSETTTRVLMSQVLISYAHLHKIGYAHNDLKTENIVIDKNLNAKIIDFGTAEPITKSCKKHSCGTTMYFAPEKMTGYLKKKEDREAVVDTYNNYHGDMFSLAMIMYALLCRDFLFSESSERATEYRCNAYDALELVELKKFEKKTKENKLTYRNGAGVKFLASLVEQDPSKRFKVEWMVKSHPNFNEEIYQYLKVTNEDLSIYQKEISKAIDVKNAE